MADDKDLNRDPITGAPGSHPVGTGLGAAGGGAAGAAIGTAVGGPVGAVVGAAAGAVVGGLAFSQMVTLFVTPVIFTYMDEFQHWVAARFRRKSREPVTQSIPALHGAD